MKQISREDLQKFNKKDCVRFALFCANQVAHLDSTEEGKRCREITALWLEGKATGEQCRASTYATYAADAYASAYAANAYANANAASANAACAAYASADASANASACAASASADASAYAAYAAAYATYAENNKKLIEEQWEYYYDILHFDKRFEEAVFG